MVDSYLLGSFYVYLSAWAFVLFKQNTKGAKEEHKEHKEEIPLCSLCSSFVFFVFCLNNSERPKLNYFCRRTGGLFKWAFRFVDSYGFVFIDVPKG